MKRKSIILGIIAGAMMITLCGCGTGSHDELSSYKKQVESFYSTVTKSDEAINQINPKDKDASQQLLKELDSLDLAFTQFGDIEVPMEFASAESLADEAATYMSESVKLYHTAFESAEYDEFSATMAKDKYDKAILRINYIGEILQGKELEGEGITVIYDSETTEEQSDIPIEETE